MVLGGLRGTGVSFGAFVVFGGSGVGVGRRVEFGVLVVRGSSGVEVGNGLVVDALVVRGGSGVGSGRDVAVGCGGWVVAVAVGGSGTLVGVGAVVDEFAVFVGVGALVVVELINGTAGGCGSLEGWADAELGVTVGNRLLKPRAPLSALATR